MRDVFIINKKEGETPLEALESFRHKKEIAKKIPKGVPMTYAGRLDPMASGILIILVGEECKHKDKYLKLDKEYEFEVLFGFATDTYDILGKVQHSYILENVGMSDLEKIVKKKLKFFKGKFMQRYPMYSSKTVDGRQLHEYARSGERVQSPEHEVEVKSLKYLGMKKISRASLFKNIETRIEKVNQKNDFRQKEILKLWRKELNVKHRVLDKILVAKFRARVSSGTYIRSVAHDLGARVGTPALALKIKRTKVAGFAKIS